MKYQYLTIQSIALISFFGLAYFVVIILAMHKLCSGYNPRSRYISEYAIGKYGQLVESSFVIYGLAILGIFLCLHTILLDRAQSKVALTSISIWGISVVITGFFDTDLKAERISWHGAIHIIASNIGFVASAIAFILLSFTNILIEKIQPISFVLQMIAVIAMILAVLLLLGLIGDIVLKYRNRVHGILLSLHKITGLTERFMICISVVWLTIMIYLIIRC